MTSSIRQFARHNQAGETLSAKVHYGVFQPQRSALHLVSMMGTEPKIYLPIYCKHKEIILALIPSESNQNTPMISIQWARTTTSIGPDGEEKCPHRPIKHRMLARFHERPNLSSVRAVHFLSRLDPGGTCPKRVTRSDQIIDTRYGVVSYE